MDQQRFSLILSISLTGLVSAACASIPAPTSLTTIVLETPVHFTASDGSDVLAAPGSYRVEAGEPSQVRLTPLDDKPPLLVQGLPMNYGQEVSSPVALSLPGDEEDSHHVVLLLPGGTGLDAAGSLSAVRARGSLFPLLSQAQVQAALAQRKLDGSPPVVLSPSADPAWQQTVDKVIESYIRSHPEVIEQALQGLDAKRRAEEQARVKRVIAAHQGELLNDPASPVSGNLNGDVTVVEFFDYRCGFCKRVAAAVTQLQKDDARVRVVYKNFPILGEASELAAKAALASSGQGRHQQFHEALLAAKTELTKEQVLHIAADVGLDATQLERDIENPEWTTSLDNNRALAKNLGITGTPAFVVGNELHTGVLDLKALKELIAQTQAR